MIDLDSLQEIAATLGKHKLRTFLTALGVFWGIFMLIALLAMGDSLERGIGQQMSGFAPNSVWAWGEKTNLPYQGFRPGRWVQFEVDDAAALARIPGVQHVAPRIQLGGWRDGNNVVRGGRTGNFQVMGDYPAVRHVIKMDVQAGRFLNELDLAEARKVVVIGETIYRQLFAPGEDAIGAHLKIRGVYFEVVGVVRPKGKGDNLDRMMQTAWLPFSTFAAAFNTGDRVGFFAIVVDPGGDSAAIEREIRATLAKRHQIAPDDEEAIGSENAAEEVGKVTMLFLGIRLFIWVVGSFTLMAGILGVSNIMLIAVKERTKEFGVRKALGARPATIVRMVLAEALALTAIAGYVGFLAAVLAIEGLGPLLDGKGPLVAPQIDFPVAIAATIVLVVGGVLAGVIPARHAARIKPVEALRAE
jgi:putative ABC transport system permease protein